MTSTLSHALRVTHPAAYEALEAGSSVSARILARAGELLIEKGWCQGRGTDDHGRRCTVHVIATAALELVPNDADAAHMMAREYVTDVLADRYRDFDGHIDHWNDRATTTLDDVLDVLAAARALVDGCSAAVQR